MVMKSFDLSRFSGMLGIFFIGSAFSLYLLSQIISIVAKTVVDNYVSMITMLNTTIILIIFATISFIGGCLLLALNSRTAESKGLPADSASRMNVMLLLVGTLLVFFVLVIINALIPVPVFS